ncbi:MAG: TolC family protein [bacterium]|nr:TolC family protein [bacterium]
MLGKMYKCVFFCLLLVGKAMAQDALTVQEAIALALQKNYSILVAKNQQEIARVQNNAGNAGLSPTLSLNGGLTSANLNSYQVFSTGAVQDKTGAKSNGLAGTVNADWTVFDGLRMFAIRKRLSMNETLSALDLKRQMENTVFDVISLYFNVVRVKQLIAAAKQDLQIYEERRKIAELRQAVGSDSKVEVLLSKSDENRARSVIVQLELDLLTSKTSLNTLLGRRIDIDFNAVDSIAVNYNPTLDELKKTVYTSNTALLMSKQSEMIFGESVKEARALTLPFLTVNGSYVYARTESQSGFLFSNRQNGLNLGLTGKWVFFSGGKNLNLIKERNILALNQRLITEQTQLQVDAVVYVNYQSYLLNKQIVVMEYQNLLDSKEVQNISLERYKIGKANLLETIETQKNLEIAQVRYINALYAIKLAEASLLRVNGNLVK